MLRGTGPGVRALSKGLRVQGVRVGGLGVFLKQVWVLRSSAQVIQGSRVRDGGGQLSLRVGHGNPVCRLFTNEGDRDACHH